ncbi:MAG: PadR family transcriptional regulator [Candidatus Helarchaeota archaeon]
MIDKDIFHGFIKIHILYHANKEKIYGGWIKEELKRHGYEISPGTLYPTLHFLEKKGYLKVSPENIDGKVRKYYQITEEGKKILNISKLRIKELFGEIINDK